MLMIEVNNKYVAKSWLKQYLSRLKKIFITIYSLNNNKNMYLYNALSTLKPIFLTIPLTVKIGWEM